VADEALARDVVPDQAAAELAVDGFAVQLAVDLDRSVRLGADRAEAGGIAGSDGDADVGVGVDRSGGCVRRERAGAESGGTGEQGDGGETGGDAQEGGTHWGVPFSSCLSQRTRM